MSKIKCGKKYFQVKISRFYTKQALGCWSLLGNAFAGACKYSSDDAIFLKRRQNYFWKTIADFSADDFIANP